MSGTGIDSMFFSDVARLAEQVDQALVTIKSNSEDESPVSALADRLTRLTQDDTDSVALRLLLILADRECRGVAFWSQFAQQLIGARTVETIGILESLAQSLEHEQAQLEQRLWIVS